MDLTLVPVRMTLGAGLAAIIFANGGAVSSPLGPDMSRVEEIEVISRISRGTPGDQALSGFELDRAALAAAPRLQLDEVLRTVPGFGLFRRSPAAVANPTGQGVSLRGLGPNGAGRTLVLLDGVPLNDPFGGWVPFSRLPAALIQNARLTPGGGAGPWGNAAIAGTVRLTGRRDPGLRADIDTGRFGATEGLVHGGFDQGQVFGTVDAARFRRGGYRVVDPRQVGAVDVPAFADGRFGQAAIGGTIGPVTLMTKVGAFVEDRGNGTPGSFNSTRATDFSLRAFSDRLGPLTKVEAVIYGQRTVFANRFTSVDTARRVETPALDQFSVPARALGFGFSAEVNHNETFGTVIGLDARGVDGETNELFQLQNGVFQRRREAGGRERFSGIFLEPHWHPSPGWDLSVGLRADQWSIDNGRRLETPVAGGAPVRADRYAARSGQIASGRIGIARRLDDATRFRMAAYTGFRVPTLNELYRPFRVGSDIVEANPVLRLEHLRGAEFGIETAIPAFGDLSATLFHAQIRGAVDNVQLTDRAGNYLPLNIVVPAGGTLAQRLNLDETVVQGLEARLHRSILPGLEMEAYYLWSLPRVTRASVSPALVGRRLAQTSRHQGGISLSARLGIGTSMRADFRGQSAGFDDGLNQRRLHGATVLDFRIDHRLNPNLSVRAGVLNAADTLTQTGLRGDGLIAVGPSRQWTLGIQANY